jgi:flagellar hook-length control protein FliK
MRETPLDPEARTASRFFGNNYANEGAGGRQSPTRKLTAEEKQQYAEDYGVEFFNALKLYREKEKAANASTQTSTASGASDPDVSDVGGAGFTAVEEICVERLAAETPAVMSLYPEDEQAKLSRWSTDSETPTKE